ncbi:MAG TPA: methyltransferase [Pyrinomonadaceae bacterium]|nr:methyltransferase [Pyrinomonadaceae bacterium]
MSATQVNTSDGAQGQLPPPIVLMQMATGYIVSQALYVAAKLQVADLLKDGPRTSEELAQAAGADARFLYRTLRALASVGVFAETEQGSFTLTPTAELLRTDVQGSMHAMVIWMNEPFHWRVFEEMLDAVKTGKLAFEQVFGMEPFPYLVQHPELARIFNNAMTSFSLMSAPTVTAAYDFSSIKKLVDVAGGHGLLISSILKANPHMQGVLFDMPTVIEGAGRLIEEAGVSDRCEKVAGNFFESVPEGGDAYIMKHIIHDWDDERSLTILKNCYRAMTENGKLLLVEVVIPPGNEPSFGKIMDIEMMLLPGGTERTEAEYRELFAAAGFRLTRVVPTQSPASVIEGVRV